MGGRRREREWRREGEAGRQHAHWFNTRRHTERERERVCVRERGKESERLKMREEGKERERLR